MTEKQVSVIFVAKDKNNNVTKKEFTMEAQDGSAENPQLGLIDNDGLTEDGGFHRHHRACRRDRYAGWDRSRQHRCPQVVRRGGWSPGLHAAAVEHAPVIRRIFIEVGDLFAQAFLLERRDRIGRCELYFRVSYHGLHSDLSLFIARSSSLRGTPASSALPKLCAARSSSPCER